MKRTSNIIWILSKNNNIEEKRKIGAKKKNGYGFKKFATIETFDQEELNDLV